MKYKTNLSKLFLAILIVLFLTEMQYQAPSRAAPIGQGTLNIVVTSTSGSTGGPDCTLRDAITAANTDTPTGGCPAGSGADTIILASGETYTLTTVDNTTDGANGLPSIISKITIEGNGATIERSFTAPDFRIFYVAENGNLALDQLTIRNGNANTSPWGGGGIYSFGTVTLTNSTVSGNNADGDGGGILNRNGPMTLTNSIVSDNSTNRIGGGLLNFLGTVTLINSEISGNSTNNDSSNIAGGIYNQGTMTLINSIVSDNSANHEGGGIFNKDRILILTNSTVSGNSAVAAGGIWNHFGTVMLTNSTVSNNSATVNGGGLTNYFGTMTLTNSTISGNNGGGSAGAIFNISGTVVLANSTVSNNSAVTAGGISNYDKVEVANSILAAQALGTDCAGPTPVTSLGFNLDSDGTCITDGVNNDITSATPGLGQLTDNGGPTETIGLEIGSPAIDAGNPDGCTDADGNILNEDQRGEARPIDGDGDGIARCDIGAFEGVVAPPSSPPVANDDGYNTNEDTQLSVLAPGVLTNDDDVDGDALIAKLLISPSNGSLIQNPDGAFIYDPNPDFNGVDSYTYEACDPSDLCDSATVTITIFPVNDPPDITVDQAEITVIEGQTATNSGTVSDIDSASVTLSASEGNVETDSGTWSWSFTTGSSDETQTVSIIANDNQGGISQVNFDLIVLTPVQAIQDLIDAVEEINQQQDIPNGLDDKLNAALNALDDLNENNDGAAINSLQAFINTVEAQREKSLNNNQADLLIALAQRIIDSLV